MTRNALIVSILAVSFTLGCAHKDINAPTDPLAATSDEPINVIRPIESFHVNDPEPPNVVDAELETIPTEINPMVEKWIAYFQGKGRPHMERYLSRSGRYSTLIKRILRQNGMPEDLIYIALIESGFSSKATSRAAAVGYWQFIKGTGRRYGLEVNSFIDERRDPVMSTQAAAEYYKGLYSIFGSWYLAMASYNAGENRIKRAVMTHASRDFWYLAKQRKFPRETGNYIPKFIAAKLIGKDPAKYGFSDIEYEKPIEFDQIKVDKPINLRLMAEKMNFSYEEFKMINPKFKGEIAPLKGDSLELRIPIGQLQVAMAAAQESFVDKVELIADAGETDTYKIKSGESLFTVAKKFKTTVAYLRDINDIPKKRKLRVGQKIQVPDNTGKTPTKLIVVAKREKPIEEVDKEKANVNPEIVTKTGVFYVVQPGDTLSAIADDYDTSIAILRKMNKLSRGGMIRVGSRLKVPPKDDKLPDNPDAEVVKTEDGTANELKVDRTADNADDLRNPAAAIVNHLVRPGENLFLIAKKYGVSIDALRKANNLSRRSTIRAGTTLKIPTVASEKTTTGTTTSRRIKYALKQTKQARSQQSIRGSKWALAGMLVKEARAESPAKKVKKAPKKKTKKTPRSKHP